MLNRRQALKVMAAGILAPSLPAPQAPSLVTWPVAYKPLGPGPISPDVWEAFFGIQRYFDQRMGLSDLMYGSIWHVPPTEGHGQSPDPPE